MLHLTSTSVTAGLLIIIRFTARYQCQYRPVRKDNHFIADGPLIRFSAMKRSSARLLQNKMHQNSSLVMPVNCKVNMSGAVTTTEHVSPVKLARQKRKVTTETAEEQPSIGAKMTKKAGKTMQQSNPHIDRKRGRAADSSKNGNHTSTDSSPALKLVDSSSDDCMVKSPKNYSKTEINKRQKDTHDKKIKKADQMSSHVQIFETLRDKFESLRDDSRGAAMSKYLRNKFKCFGIPSPQRRAACAELWKDVKGLDASDLRALALQAWNSPEREMQHFTVDMLEREKFRLYADLTSSREAALKSVEYVKGFIAHPAAWWDTVDPLSSNVIGPLVRKQPDVLLPEMDKWNASSCFWQRRTSLIYQLTYKKDTDQDRLFRFCLNLAHEEEFFIRKAIGWALRAYHRTNPEAVRNFVKNHKDKLSTLSVKEALKHDK